MITDKTLDKVSNTLALRMETASLKSLEIIAKRVKEIGKLTPDDVYRLELLRNIGADVSAMESFLAQATSMNIRDIDRIYKAEAKKIYKEQSKFYKATGVEQVAFERNEIMQSIVTAQANITKDKLRNLSGSEVISFSKVKNGKRVKVHKSIRKAYQDIVDQAITIVSSGAIDYNKAIAGAVDDIADSGIRYLDYKSDRSINVYSATRMNIMDGMRLLARDIRDQAGKEFGANGVEITAHGLCAPDHLEYQGQQYTNKEFKDLDNRLKKSGRPISTLNCHHTTFPIVMGVSEPVYDKETLEAYRKQTEDENIQIGDKKYSQYQCSQLQRKIENSVRKDKIKKAVEKTAGNDTTKVDKRLKMLNNKYNEVSKKSGLPRRPELMRVPKNLLR